MTTQYPTPPQQGWPPQPPPQPTAPQPPKHHGRRNAIILASAAAVLGVIALGRTVEPTTTATPPARAPAVQATTAAPAVTEPVATSPPEPTYDTPKRADFTLSIKELARDRFGSAGDLVTYRVKAGWDGTYDPAKTYEVTYQIIGGEDGAITETMEISGDEYRNPDQDTIGTTSNRKLTAKVIEVEEV
jgi:hypothetical protein